MSERKNDRSDKKGNNEERKKSKDIKQPMLDRLSEE